MIVFFPKWFHFRPFGLKIHVLRRTKEKFWIFSINYLCSTRHDLCLPKFSRCVRVKEHTRMKITMTNCRWEKAVRMSSDTCNFTGRRLLFLVPFERQKKTFHFRLFEAMSTRRCPTMVAWLVLLLSLFTFFHSLAFSFSVSTPPFSFSLCWMYRGMAIFYFVRHFTHFSVTHSQFHFASLRIVARLLLASSFGFSLTFLVIFTDCTFFFFIILQFSFLFFPSVCFSIRLTTNKPMNKSKLKCLSVAMRQRQPKKNRADNWSDEQRKRKRTERKTKRKTSETKTNEWNGDRPSAKRKEKKEFACFIYHAEWFMR